MLRWTLKQCCMQAGMFETWRIPISNTGGGRGVILRGCNHCPEIIFRATDLQLLLESKRNGRFNTLRFCHRGAIPLGKPFSAEANILTAGSIFVGPERMLYLAV